MVEQRERPRDCGSGVHSGSGAAALPDGDSSRRKPRVQPSLCQTDAGTGMDRGRGKTDKWSQGWALKTDVAVGPGWHGRAPPTWGHSGSPREKETWLSEKQRGLFQTKEAASAQAQGETEVQAERQVKAADRASQGHTVTKELSVLF